MERDSSIDLLRFWGLSLIILAHIGPPETLFHIRCFDVPMMLFVSGMAYANKSADFSLRFFSHRIKRLIIPVYLFLTAYFALTAVLKFGAGIDFGIRLKHILGSYLLQDGIGFVWIIRVFLLVGLLTPFILALDRRVANNRLFIGIVLTILLVLQLLIDNQIGLSNIVIRDYLYYAVGYAIPFMMGVRFKRFSSWKALIAMVAVLGLCYLGTATEHFFKFNDYKYPPQTIYICYGVVMSILMYKYFTPPPCWAKHKVVKFIGTNTIWIYLYHIPFIQLTGLITSLSWWLRYIIVYALSVGVCYIQVSLVDYVSSRTKEKDFYKYLKG